jgi:hypothetical protein
MYIYIIKVTVLRVLLHSKIFEFIFQGHIFYYFDIVVKKFKNSKKPKIIIMAYMSIILENQTKYKIPYPNAIEFNIHKIIKTII